MMLAYARSHPAAGPRSTLPTLGRMIQVLRTSPGDDLNSSGNIAPPSTLPQLLPLSAALNSHTRTHTSTHTHTYTHTHGTEADEKGWVCMQRHRECQKVTQDPTQIASSRQCTRYWHQAGPFLGTTISLGEGLVGKPRHSTSAGSVLFGV